MRLVVVGLLAMLAGLQYKLWLGEDSILQWMHLDKKLEVQRVTNEALVARNQAIDADIAELKSGEQALEERARYDLGMIKEGEAYYQFID